LALLTFILSLVSAFPGPLVEAVFSRTIFPRISEFSGIIADALPVAWLDVLLPGAILYIVVCLRRKRWMAIGVAIGIVYLIFFWSWGINYHRIPLSAKLSISMDATTSPAMDAFTQQAIQEINSLSASLQGSSYEPSEIQALASNRVAHVVEVLDGTRWSAAQRVKTSYLANPWFRVAGIDGVFNPIVHEPILSSSIVDVELPFVMAHELAHVRGYPDEGDANFVSIMATIMSDDARLRYSGWLHLWLYLRTRELDAQLDAAARQDLQRIFDRLRRERIDWISNVQSAVLDLFLKANSVSEGVKSYSRVVLLIAGTRQSWDRFK